VTEWPQKCEFNKKIRRLMYFRCRKMFATSKRQRWLIGLTQVNETIKVTTQNCI
jgi:hypothetical protein